MASLLCSHVEGQVMVMHEPVAVDTQLAITLYYLSDEGRLRKVVNAFGLSRSCCSIIVTRASSALQHIWVLPTTETSMKEKVKFLPSIFNSTMLGSYRWNPY